MILEKGTHGFYLPDIRTWNMFVDEISKKTRENCQKYNILEPVLRGSVEDLENGLCDHCGNELIRLSANLFNKYFDSAIIYCPRIESKGHTNNYWIEVWPIARPDGIKSIHDYASLEDSIIARFKLSDPKIRKCYYQNLLAQFYQSLDPLILEYTHGKSRTNVRTFEDALREKYG